MTRANRCLGILLLTLAWCSGASAQSTVDCLICHEDPSLTTERDGREVSLAVDPGVFARSIHADFGCTACHADLEGAELPHADRLAPVDCGSCHGDVAELYAQSLHGQAVVAQAPFAPHCWDCHGAHDILPSTTPGSRVTRFNIPFMCGRCHKEGTEVTRTYDIPQDSILTHYSLSMHGEGLYRKGLTNSAVCTDCHTAHSVLPHTDPRSTIFRANVPGTCEQCHGLIEEVHRKVIRGELWEQQPDKVPICIDCHSPHKVRRIFYEQGMADRDCMMCHGKPDLFTIRQGDTLSLYVDEEEVRGSDHRTTACAQCHTGGSPSAIRACETITTKVDCSICHAEVVRTYAESIHGELADRGDPIAPRCNDCHGTHGTLDHRNPSSPTYPTNVPDLCGQCHRDGSQAAARFHGQEREILKNYVMSIHGKGLLESGLVVTAQCSDCHTAHHQLPVDDPASSVNRENIPKTCATCHIGIYEQFERSIHSPKVAKTDKELPGCSDCHSSHTIARTDKEGFRLNIINQCGRCHEDVTETYFETYHGKVSKLGSAAAAKCYDCHGAHDVLPTYEPKSRLSRQNIVKTCGACHPGSHRRFAGYLTHATHHERDKYPALFYAFWFMTSLLIVTLTVAGAHAVLWLPRSFQAMRRHRKLKLQSAGREYRRFPRFYRQLHILVIISFLGLALTGMTLKFSYLGWAQVLSSVLGGFESAGYIHRVCAVITFFYFGAHIWDVLRKKHRFKQSWKDILTGPNSMVFNRKDGEDFVASLKWFIGRGPRPDYGRWTYWEKFDYLAVFWGVAIIGSTGLLLWFPEQFTWILPGQLINVATIIHSDEALLAVAFIFTIHFFNTHFRPDKFPMDTVIFTGRVPLEEFKLDRPQEYEQLVKSGELEQHLVQPLPEVVVRGTKIFGGVALAIGLMLILLIIYAVLFGYR